jgi:ABC-type glycerol-3-phosphate transport system substrate-binding protein
MTSPLRRLRPQVVLCTMLLAVLLIAAASPAVAGRKVQVVISGSIAKQLEGTWGGFEEKTGIEVEPIVLGNWFDVMEKLPVMVIGGLSPDVIYHDSATQADLYHRGVLQPIEKYVTRDRLNLKMWPAPIVDAYRYAGVLYSLPTAVSNWITFYNRDKFHAAGLDDLPTDWNGSAFTFEDLINIGRKLTRDINSDGQIDEYGISNFLASGSVQAIHLWGADWYDPDQTEFIGNSAETIAAITELRRLREVGVVGGNWMQGKAAIMTEQPYYLNTIATAMAGGGMFNWAVGILPKAVGRWAHPGFHSLGMVYDAPHPEEAWQFIKFMTTDSAGTVHFSQAENRTPVAPRSIIDFNRRWEAFNPGMNAHAFTTCFDHLIRANWFGLPRKMYDTITSSMSRIMRMEQDPKGAMDALKPVIDSMLKEAKENLRKI